MGNSNKISFIINAIFIIVLVIILLYIIFKITQTLYIDFFEDSKQVTDVDTISELQQCITKYYDYLYYGQYEKVKHCSNILNKKSNTEYEEIHDEIVKYGEYTIVVKYAYELYPNTYRCYVTTYDKTKENYLDYVKVKDLSKMDKIVISLDRYNDNFTILNEVYYML